MSEYANRFKIGDFTPRGLVDPKFQVDGVILPTILLLKKLKITATMRFKVIEVGTNRTPVCDFLLVINTN